MTDRKQRVVATWHQNKKISTLLETVLIKLDNGCVEYKAGWDDEKVAKTVDENLSGRSAERIRKLDFGQLNRVLPEILKKKAHKFSSHGELNARVTRLERIIEKLADDLGVDVPARPSKPNGIHINP